ncbi:MAG: hypothetical protein JRJ57_01035 [Deltaproteobacteria bacterium]|nr:hypothetical protein [Deltaproteobacteria bacterium]
MAYIISTILFAVGLFLTGLFTMRWIKGVPSFVIAGREIGLFVGIAGIAAMGVAGQMIVMQSALMVSFGYLASLSNVIPYAIIGMILYGFTLGPVIRRSGAQTLPEYIEMRYSRNSRFIIAITQILGMMGVVALSTVAQANITKGLLGWPWPIGITVFFLMYLIFVVAGGFWSVSITDFWQFVLAIIILPLTVIYLISHYGGIGFLTSSWPHNFWTTGYAGMKMRILSPVHPSYLTLGWIFIAIVWGSSYFWMRAAASRDEKIAKISYIGGGLFILLLAPIGYSLFGAYSAVINPGVFKPLGAMPPDTAAGLLMKGMSVWVALPLYLAILAASISTGSTAVIGTSASIQRDILRETRWGDSVHGSRILVTLTLIGIWALCWYPKAIVFLFSYVFAWFIPSAVAIWLGLYWRRVTSTSILLGAVVSAVAMAVLQLAQLTGIWKTWHIAHPAMFGTGFAIVFMVGITFFTKTKYYGKKEWSAKPSSLELSGNITIQLEQLHLKILDWIRKNYNTTADLLDLSTEDPFVTYTAIEDLDKDRLIERKSLSGLGFHTYSITEKGIRSIVPLSGDEKMLEGYGLEPLSFELLKISAKDPKNYAVNFTKAGHSLLGTQAVITKLINLGYMHSSGVFYRKIKLTDKGKNVLRELEIVK